MNMMDPWGKDRVLLPCPVLGGVCEAEMECNSYTMVRAIRISTSPPTTVKHLGTWGTPESREDSRQGFAEVVTFELNCKGWVGFGPENYEQRAKELAKACR